ncbi:MAG: sigma-54-dependent Fis family transcriptional regulator [Planctomycetes bacterium]|nr:sigma-54-dependent Fis family transcriptional regulator [Planctomycetota bacterium]
MSLSRIVALSKDPEVQKLAQKYGRKVFGADDLTDAVEVIQTANPDLILFDQWLGINNVREFIFQSNANDKNEFSRRTDKKSADIPIVIVGCGDDNTDLAAEFIRIGAYGYLGTRQDYAQLERIINSIKSKSKDFINDKNTSLFFSDELACSVSMVGSSKAMQNTLNMIKLVAASKCNPILIVGETGTGKELAAKAIHVLRHPKEQYVAVNCAALTANLLESELFGHVKGSFTGADREKTGLLELAESGTLLLDEISEMPMELQAKLLRVLQEKSFRKVGGVKDIACNATIIASSNRNLKNEVQANRFRRDLYYRLNICPITLAPLRSQMRKQDIRILAEYFLRTSTICPDKCGKITSLTELAIEALEKHDWPGNVRELCNVIERAILLETTEKIGLNGIIIDPAQWSDGSKNPTPGIIKDFSLAKAECELISRALQKTGWQKTRAAALLGITRATLYAKVKQYNIEKNSHMDSSNEGQGLGEPNSSYLSQPVAVPS